MICILLLLLAWYIYILIDCMSMQDTYQVKSFDTSTQWSNRGLADPCSCMSIKLCRQCIIIRWYVQKYPDPDTFFRRSYGEVCLLVGGGVFKGLLSVFHDGNLKNKNVTGGLGLRTLSLRSEHKSTDPAFYIHCTIEKIYLHSSSKR